MSDLFNIPESKSPKLTWLSKHNLATKQNDRTSVPLDPNPWTCANLARTQSAFGVDEMEATVNYCEKFGIKHWTLE